MYQLHDKFYFSLSQNFPNSQNPSVLHREYKITVLDPTVKCLDSFYNPRLPFLLHLNIILRSTSKNLEYFKYNAEK
jgi:hypothetical protein